MSKRALDKEQLHKANKRPKATLASIYFPIYSTAGTQPDANSSTALSRIRVEDGGEETRKSSNYPHQRRQLYRHHPLRELPLIQRSPESARASSVLQGALENSLIHYKTAKSIGAWSEDDLFKWLDDDGKALQQQLERWAVRCPLCFLYRDITCNKHVMSECQRPAKEMACLIESRLRETLVDIQDRGIGGYGEVPWCGGCCLPRSRCPMWEKTDGEGERRGDDRAWHRIDDEWCRFYLVVIHAVSAMLTFQLPSGITLLQQVKIWQEGSRTQFNSKLDLDGLEVGKWLMSPMWWDSRQVMIMLRVFYQLDMAVEEAWVLKAIERRQVELNALSLQQWNDWDSTVNHVAAAGRNQKRHRREKMKMDINSADEGYIKDALYDAAEELKRYTDMDSYWWAVQARIQEWGEGAIQCQLCRAYAWSELCYTHSARVCEMWVESERFRTLVNKLSGLDGEEKEGTDADADEGEDKEADEGYGTCQTCRFPVAVCQPISRDDRKSGRREAEWGRCRGTDVLKQTVAALLVIAGGKLGKMVIDEEMAEWRQSSESGRWVDMMEEWKKGGIGFEGLADEWIQQQVSCGRGGQPRIVRIFLQLTGGFRHVIQ
ncbi:hypothetical protein CI102_6735 [Trichoderma harzianum]|nr:hypothetical protein CI102_6735 [Trichoderma harzianum]